MPVAQEVEIDSKLLETLNQLEELGIYVCRSDGNYNRDCGNRILKTRRPKWLPSLEETLETLDEPPFNPLNKMARLAIDFSDWTGTETDWQLLKQIEIPFTVAAAEQTNDKFLKMLAETKCQGLHYCWYSNDGEIKKVPRRHIELITKCENLRCVSFSYCDFEVRDLKLFDGSPITQLEFLQNVDQDALNMLGKIKQLESLIIGRFERNETPDLSVLRRLKNLTSFTILEQRLDPFCLSVLERFPALRSLQFTGGDAHVVEIAGLKQLTTLRAYPKTPAALSVVYAKENCSMAR